MELLWQAPHPQPFHASLHGSSALLHPLQPASSLSLSQPQRLPRLSCGLCSGIPQNVELADVQLLLAKDKHPLHPGVLACRATNDIWTSSEHSKHFCISGIYFLQFEHFCEHVTSLEHKFTYHLRVQADIYFILIIILSKCFHGSQQAYEWQMHSGGRGVTQQVPRSGLGLKHPRAVYFDEFARCCSRI